MKKTKISKLQYNINNQKACYLYKKTFNARQIKSQTEGN